MKNIFKPVLFGTDMVQANLADRKTKTRRTQGLEEINKKPDDYILDGIQLNDFFIFHSKSTSEEIWIKPKYNVGDILWVRETFIHWNGNYQYKPLPFGEELGKWKPSIHMPKEAARIFLYVTNVRTERLQDITEADAIAEGIEKQKTNYGDYLFKHYLKDKFGPSAKHSFQTLWQKINGIESWDKNPYVWVYEYERIEKPKDFI